jgi:hypothetical protein
LYVFICILRVIYNADLVLTSDQLKSYALSDIEALLQCHGKSLDNYKEMPKTDRGLVSEVQNRLIYDELSYNRRSLDEEHHNLMASMTDEQRGIYDRIMSRVTANKPGFFFLYMDMVELERPIFGGHCQQHYDQLVRLF